MVPLFWLSLFLTCLPLQGAARLQSCLSQPSNVILRETGQDGEIWCGVHPNCSDKGLHYQWFTFKRSSHIRLNLDDMSHKYSLQGATLQIMSLNTNDSGIYYCGAVSPGEPRPGAQHVGLGTTLVVREKTKLMVGHVLLWLTFVLLVSYSLTTVTLIVQKKYGLNIWNCRRLCKSDKQKSSTNKTTIFRDVLQEMRHRRDLKRSKQASRRNPAQLETTATEWKNTPDDIYQNV
ncbi:immunoglobulin superfamily member 6 [Dunckerocampus dactyliophorus]|uniref:immunoglobulin superfamily member 6 n=1 Tax=Dunckerocampus dactyliophorus TaxID=161453 RepID=UPI0024067B8D|nr:immunoglobulin superfamily member 6 [Dunckerocampus dactyliophorus]